MRLGCVTLNLYFAGIRFPETIEEFENRFPEIYEAVYQGGRQHAGINFTDLYLDLRKVPCRPRKIQQDPDVSVLQTLVNSLKGNVGKGGGDSIKILDALQQDGEGQANMFLGTGPGGRSKAPAGGLLAIGNGSASSASSGPSSVLTRMPLFRLPPLPPRAGGSDMPLLVGSMYRSASGNHVAASGVHGQR